MGWVLGRARGVAGLGSEVDSKASARHTWGVFQPHRKALFTLPPSAVLTPPLQPTYLGTCYSMAQALLTREAVSTRWDSPMAAGWAGRLR